MATLGEGASYLTASDSALTLLVVRGGWHTTQQQATRTTAAPAAQPNPTHPKRLRESNPDLDLRSYITRPRTGNLRAAAQHAPDDGSYFGMNQPRLWMMMTTEEAHRGRGRRRQVRRPLVCREAN